MIAAGGDVCFTLRHQDIKQAMNIFGVQDLTSPTNALPLTINIFSSGVIKVFITGQSSPIVVVHHSILLPIKYLRFANFGDRETQWFYNCASDSNGDKLKLIKQNYLKILEEKQTEDEFKNSLAAAALLQKLRVLVESSQDLDKAISMLYSNMPSDYLHSSTANTFGGQPELRNFTNILDQLDQNMKKTIALIGKMILAYENHKFLKFRDIFKRIPELDGNSSCFYMSNEEVKQLNKAVISAIDHTTNVSKTIKTCNGYYQKRYIISFDIIAIEDQLWQQFRAETPDEVGKENLLNELQTKIEEIRSLKSSDVCTNDFPGNIAADMDALKLDLDEIVVYTSSPKAVIGDVSSEINEISKSVDNN